MDKTSRKRTSVGEGKGHEHVKNVLVEFDDVIMSHSFIKEKVHAYALEHVSEYITQNFDKEEVKKAIEDLKKEKCEGCSAIPENGGKDETIKAVVEVVKCFVNKCDCCYKAASICTPVIKGGITKKEITPELYSDVTAAFKQWKEKNLKIVVVTNKCKDVVLSLILTACDGINESDIHVESMAGKPLSVKETYVHLAEHLKLNASESLFITKCQNEAVASSAAGFDVNIIKRKQDSKDEKKNDKKEEKKDESSFNIIHSLEEVLLEQPVPTKVTKASEGAK